LRSVAEDSVQERYAERRENGVRGSRMIASQTTKPGSSGTQVLMYIARSTALDEVHDNVALLTRGSVRDKWDQWNFAVSPSIGVFCERSPR
jgi:hypothetical protein